MKKTLCAIIAFIMLITSLSASAAFDVFEEAIIETEVGIVIKDTPQNIQALFTAEKSDNEHRILPPETPFDIRMESSDGTGVLEIFAAPVRYADENGELQFIDTSMKKAGVFSGYDYENAANDFSVKYSKDATKGIQMDDAFAFSIPGAPTGLFSKKAAVGLDENKDGILTYPGAFGEHTYVEYINTSTGFKENIVLEKNIGTNRFEFKWQSDSHTPILSEDGRYIQFVSNDDPEQIDYKMLHLLAYDSSESEAEDDGAASPATQGFSEDVLSPSEYTDIRENNELSKEKSAEPLEIAEETPAEATTEEESSLAYDPEEPDDAPQFSEYRHITSDCYYELEKQADGSYTITVVVSEEYLNHPETVYPVTIDPSMSTTQSSSAITDTYVSQQSPNENNGSAWYLLFGRDEKNYKNFVYLKFNQIPSLLSVPGAITKATVRVNFLTSSSYSKKTGMMLRANGSWTENGLTWNNQPYGVTPTYTSPYYSGNYYDFVITPIAQGWYTKAFANNGVDMTFYPETELGYCYMYSSEYGTASLAPKLTIEYDSIVWPMSNSYNHYITSRWGFRTYDGKHHQGIDIRADVGTPVLAAASGTVETINTSRADNQGIYMVLKHSMNGTTFYTRYMHLKSIQSGMTVGKQVSGGSQIAESGNTAQTGQNVDAHLHFQIQFANTDSRSKTINPVVGYHSDDKRNKSPYNDTNPNPFYMLSNGLFVFNSHFYPGASVTYLSINHWSVSTDTTYKNF